jgi:5-enolpyruvylshikimate-3-phosphate synthase
VLDHERAHLAFPDVVAGLVAALVADAPVYIDDWEAVAVSYPRFAQDLASLRA